MGYMMSLGSKPVGETYLIPPDKTGTAWLMGHYYAGGDIKLIRFKPPLETPEDDSPMDRIQDLEDMVDYLLTWLNATMMEVDANHGSTLVQSSKISQKIIEWRAFLARREGLLTTSDVDYMVDNFELLQKVRGY